jgi:two-component system, OmpR family, sensor histidine kinase ChvG
VKTLLRIAGRIGVRLLVVNLLVLLVPMAGLEFARIHERQLLEGLERDMKDQAALVRALCESDLDRGVGLSDPRHAAILTEAARRTRTRVRLLDDKGTVIADSHENGPPEGPEPPAPHVIPRAYPEREGSLMSDVARDPADRNPWPDLAARSEVRSALAGQPGAYTRMRERAPGVFLFITEPIRHDGAVVGAVYAVRSTRPVLVELYRIRSGLVRVLGVAFFFTALVTMLLSLSISRPLARLSRAAKRVAAGEPDVTIPVSGGGEIAELGASFGLMKDRLDARLRYISQFAADVAHEFKSPLTSIRGAAELLGEGAADEPEARARFLRNIELDVARLDRLVSRLLELSRIEASSEVMALVDLEALLRRVADRASTPDQPVEVRYAAPVRLLRARETDLETAFLNLLDNAARFSPPGVPVEIDVSAAPSPRLPAPVAPAALRVAIRDRGPGISAAALPKIFDRFFTTDAARDGTGLGLSIVKAVVEAHGGSIAVESRRIEAPEKSGAEPASSPAPVPPIPPDRGTIFTITLPVRR